LSNDDITGPPSLGQGAGLCAGDRQTLLRVARESLCDYLREGKAPRFEVDSAALLEPRATFVTLWDRGSGELRGCRGEVPAHRPLAQSVASMVLVSATEDPRCRPVRLEEVSNIRIEISVLTPLEPIRPQEIVVGRHGLRIVKDQHSGLLLPEVAVRYGWDREEFLQGLCWKAGLPEDAWKADDAELYGFETESWGEDE
jgi:AmmeMemoRadiSam system protein A